MIAFRKKYVKHCQIQHAYGDDDVDFNEDEALHLATAAIAEGHFPPLPTLEHVDKPEGALLDIGGKACRWCGSTSHVRKSHKDCKYNNKK